MEGHPLASVPAFVRLVPLFDPLPDHGLLVRGVVVQDNVQRQSYRTRAVNLLEERKPFNMRVVFLETAENFSLQVVESGEERQRPMPDIVMRERLAVSRHQRKRGLRALKRLALALLVATKDDGFIRRIQVEADHIPELLFELWIG